MVADLIRHIRQWHPEGPQPLPMYLARGDWDRGRILFRGTCAGCHGRDAEGGVRVCGSQGFGKTP